MRCPIEIQNKTCLFTRCTTATEQIDDGALALRLTTINCYTNIIIIILFNRINVRNIIKTVSRELISFRP